MIVKEPKLFLVTWVQYKRSCDIRKCFIWDLSFTIEWRGICTCSLNYDVHVVTCINAFKRSYQCSIFINSDECKFFILITKCSYKKFEYIKRLAFASGWKPKGVWSRITYSQKSRGKSTYAFNIEKRKIYLKHEPRGNFRDIDGWTSGKFSFLGQETNRSGLPQFTDICWETLHE